jgi:dTDP-4-dehydrorhamnose 3,5-epimerase
LFGTLRGLHYQINHSQGKLIRVVFGEVFDVAVDIRKSSPTFGKWVSYYLCADNKTEVWIPPGFAHGFYTVSDWAEILYKNTDFYSPKDERSIVWNDPEIGIKWPINGDKMPILSPKDAKGTSFSLAEVYS